MTTIEAITDQLNRIHEDDAFYIVNGNHIDLTICDFDGFDENWDEIYHEFVNEEVVDEVLDWIKENADSERHDFYHYYYFGSIEVKVGFTSFDI